MTNTAKDERRQQLIEAALDEFYERGFMAARMEDIAARAGLSKGTLYLYFNSKEELFRALITTLAIPNLDMIDTIAKNAPSFDEALNQLSIFAPKMLRHSRLPKLMKVLIGDSQNFPDIIDDYRQNIIERILGHIAALLERSQRRGEIHIEDAALTARLIIAPIALSGIWQAVFATDSRHDIDLDTLFRLHIEILKKALTTGTAT
ncbi:MAG: TetR/AcrR family transcriptional regulator [bacterium]